jgi:hypothetical protein
LASRSIASSKSTGKINIDALDFTTRTRGLCQINVWAEVLAGVVHLIETSGV